MRSSYQGGKKCSFFGKFGVLCFLETSVLRFALLPYYRRGVTWYLDWRKVTNKKLEHIKVFYKRLIRHIWSQGKCYYCLIFVELRTPQDSHLKSMSPNFFMVRHWMSAFFRTKIPGVFFQNEHLFHGTGKQELLTIL